MVLTRSESGRNRTREPGMSAVTAAAGPSASNEETELPRPKPESPVAVERGASSVTSSAVTRTTGTTASSIVGKGTVELLMPRQREENQDLLRKDVHENTASATLRPCSRHSRSSMKNNEYLKIKERMAELRMERALAEMELQMIRCQRLHEEEETEDEEMEDDLASVRMDTWFNRTPLKETLVAPPLVEKSGEKVQPARETEATRDDAYDDRRGRPAQEYEGCGGGISARQSPLIDVPTLAAALTAATNNRREPPKYLQELPIFNGDSSEWLGFRASFEETRQFFSDVENLARLRKSLKGAAKETVAGLLYGKSNVTTVIERLEKRFGCPDGLIRMELGKIKAMPKIGDNPRDLCVFAGKIANIVGAAEAIEKPQYLYNPDVVCNIMEKLTPILKNKWYDYGARNKEDIPEVKKISMFLDEEADKCSPYALPEVIEGKDRGKAEKRTDRSERTFAVDSKKPPTDDQCPMCQQQHKLPDCKQFLNADVNTRWETVKKNRICFCCLKNKHRRATCKAPACGTEGCRLRHHRLLHHNRPNKNGEQSSPPKPEAITSTREVTTASSCMGKRRAFLKIAPIVLRGPITSVETYALLDEGSTVTLIDASIADVIGADGPMHPMWIQGVGAETKHERSKSVNAKIRGKYVAEEYTLEAARTVERLDFAPETVSDQDVKSCEHLQSIKEELIYERASPKVLIGQDNWHLIVSRDIRAGRKDQPVASYTQLGWVLHGCQSSITSSVAFCGNMRHISSPKEEDLDELIKQHFRLESLCIEPKKPKDDPEEKAMQILREKSERLPDGKFKTGLPWKDEKIEIPNNYSQAERRLCYLEKKLDRDAVLKEKYEERIDNLLKSGYAEKATQPPVKGRTWYLPHFPVINPAKPHKPPRLVHDASAKFSGVSLNDMLLSGPDLLQSLPGVIMRFRQYPFAVSADIKEMFMQIKIREDDRDALRFLWRGNRREGLPDEYRMTSVVFGATSSPCTALYIKNRNAEDYEKTHPKAVEAIKRNHYMDDYLQSFKSIEEAKEVAHDVDYVHKKAGFVLNGWASNEEEVVKEFTGEQENTTNIRIGGPETEKALGLLWNTKGDYIGFRVNPMKTPQDIVELKRMPTKREALSIVMALFDPLGLISPITTPAKRLFQDTWRYKIGWNDPLPEELNKKWRDWVKSLHTIEDVRINRCYDSEPVISRQLHTFVDASEEAYAAAVYWRSERKDGTVSVSLAAAKSRVTPLKPISIPRLELQAALLGARLAEKVRQEHDFEITDNVYWSDSRTALTWIRSEPKTYKTFVAHRLAEIEETTKKNEWRWLPTKENVADDATRAVPAEFGSLHRWFHGPDFLRLPKEEWPRENKEEVVNTGEERQKCHMVDKNEIILHPLLPDIQRFSRWTRLIRSTARVLQFVDLCRRKHVTAMTRKKTKKNELKDPTWSAIKQKKISSKGKNPAGNAKEGDKKFMELPASYLIKAEEMWIKTSQEDSFKKEIKRILKNEPPSSHDKLAALSTIIDSKGILRLRGRVDLAQNIEENAANPPILDGRHRYTRLYIQHVHEKLHHGGVEIVVNELRQRLWLVKIRPTVRDVIKSCLPCKIRKMKPFNPATGDLPAARLAHHARPFTFTGIDYFGPIEVTVARHREKRWGALFTCLTSRAIHIEIVHSLSADSAISALRRFIARRGCPTELWSDNATCFKAAEKELREAVMKTLQHETTNRHIKWRYIPPAAPFMGGAWERMVRAVKEALRVTLHERYPSDETLITLLVEVENTVNSRPLTHVAVDPEQPEALTPNHILIGPNCHIPTSGQFEEKDLTAKQHWRRAQALADMFWRRWIREYLPLLQYRREPQRSPSQPKLGDLVIICDSNLPRNTWPRGRIIKLYPGVDGEVRVIDVKTSGGHVFRRPTKKVIVLPRGETLQPLSEKKTTPTEKDVMQPTVSPSGDGGRMCTTTRRKM